MVTLVPRPVSAQSTEQLDDALVEETVPAAPQHISSVVRLSPAYAALVIGCLENGTKVTVLGTYGEFYQIDCIDMKGYIAKSQIQQNDNEEYYVNCITDSSETKILTGYTAEEALTLKGELRAVSMKQIGRPYIHGGTGAWGFDCCGLTQFVYKSVGISIHRTVAAQLENGVIISRDDLQCGDLVFFQNTTGWGHFASHIGMYIGNGQVIHAGNSGVGITDLDDPYLVQHYMCSRRVVLSDLPVQTILPAEGINRNINSSYWRESSQTETGLGNSFACPLAYT
jgi:hypothetical protein